MSPLDALSELRAAALMEFGQELLDEALRLQQVVWSGVDAITDPSQLFLTPPSCETRGEGSGRDR